MAWRGPFWRRTSLARPGAARGGVAERGGRHRQPAAVATNGHVVVVRLVHTCTEDQRVLLRGSPKLVQVDAAMILVFPRWDRVGGQPANVVESLTAGQPSNGGVSAPVDG